MKLSSEKKFGKAKSYPARHSLLPGGPLCHEKAQKGKLDDRRTLVMYMQELLPC